MAKRRRIQWLDWLSDRSLQGLIWLIKRLPWRARVRSMGWLAARVIGPLVGYRKRAEDNLALIYPDMPAARRRVIAMGMLDNIGRTLIENYSGEDQVAAMRDHRPQGPGWAEIQEARAAGRPILLVASHYGNWQVIRVVLKREGIAVGGLYRPFNNPYATDHYVRSFEALGGQAFPRDRRGLAGFLRSLKDGKTMAIMVDQHVANGVVMDFLGRPAATSLSAAEMALRHDALVIPCYGERRLDDRYAFDVVFEASVPHGDPVEMTQALSDNLAARIATRPDQWFWVHRRWKVRPEKLKSPTARAAAKPEAPVQS